MAEKRNDSWPDLHRFIRTSLSSNKCHKQTALQLIGNCESPVYEWASVKDFIVDYILCSDSTLREPAMKALGKFSNLVNDDQGMMEIMERMTPVVLQVADPDCSHMECDYEHITAFICLYEMARGSLKVLRNHVEQLFAMCIKIIIDQIICKNRDNGLLSLQMVTCLSMKYGPSVPLHLIPNIGISCLFAIANNLASCKTDKWLLFNPAKDDVKNGENFAMTVGILYMERIATAIGKKRMGSHLVTISQKFIQNDSFAIIGRSVLRL
ncbi:hypothetical protein PRIPAC_90986 [Pristionchus pacificus]|nr:hypothetical protein PRIPAC_90986 [Pristionchus pacificus]